MLITKRDIKLFKLYNDLRDAASHVHYMPVTVDMVASDPVKYLDETFLGIYAKKFLSEGDDAVVFPEGTFVDPATNIEYRTLDICGTVIMLDNFRAPIPKLSHKFTSKTVTCQSGHNEYMYKCVNDILKYIPEGWHIPNYGKLNKLIESVVGIDDLGFSRLWFSLINVVYYGYGLDCLDSNGKDIVFKVYNQSDGYILTSILPFEFAAHKYDFTNNHVGSMHAHSALYLPIRLVKD